jgi:hypothetical protein
VRTTSRTIGPITPFTISWPHAAENVNCSNIVSPPNAEHA